jgi:DamX protein
MVERTLISFPSQLQLIERLQHLLYLSSSITFISGEEGSGKSTLVEQLSNLLPNDTQQAFVNLSEPTSASHIRQQIISQLFKDPLFDADDSLSNSLLLLKDKQAIDVSRAVIIDNAGLLPEQLLSELAEVIKQKSAFTENEISFILLSDELNSSQMVRDIKQLPNYLDVATLTFKLAPLSADESKQLLNHRFTQIDYSPQMQHQDAIATQLSLCRGIPEKILLLATKVSSGELNNSKPSWLKTRFPAILIMLLFVAIASALVYYLYPQYMKDEGMVDIVIETEVMLPEDILATEIITEQLSGAVSTEVLAGKWRSEKQSVTDNHLSVGEADNQNRVTISELQLLQLSTSEDQTATLKSDNNDTFDTSKAGEVSESTIELPEESESILEKELVHSSPSIESENKLVVEIYPVEVINELSIKVLPELIILENKVESIDLQENVELRAITVIESVTSEPLVPLTKLNDDTFTSTDILLAVNSNMYTLQLSGFSTENSLNRFINQHQLPQINVYLYKTIRNQKPWYVVIYGQFESRDVAKRISKELPGTLNKLDSWVKKYESVHQDLLVDE